MGGLSRAAWMLVAASLVSGGASGAALAGPARTGTVRGVVRFTGKRPPRVLLDRRSDPACAKTKAYDEAVVVAGGGGLRDVFVQVVGAPAPASRAPAGAAPVVIEQAQCVYAPRVVGVRRGQSLQIRNGDATLHNVHAYMDGSTEFNLAQPEHARPIERTAEVLGVIELACDVHAWMRAYAVVVDHPYFAVSATDGRFEIRAVPAGSYTISAWHAKLGTRTATVRVVAGKTATATITFE